MAEEQAAAGGWGKAVLSWLPDVRLTAGSTLTVLLALAVSAPVLIGEAPAWGNLDLETGVLGSASFYRLITYIYVHEDLPTLACSCFIAWYFGGGFEENVGTVKFFLLTPLFAVWSGLLYLAVTSAGISHYMDGKVQGFTSVAFSMISVFIIRTNLRRLIFFGFMVPTKVMPLLFLIPAAFVPHATILSNVCGIVVGVIYGMGGCFFLDPPESLLTQIDQMVPFRLLKRITVWRYVPASSAERNASQNRKINPPPGSYPTQQYYTPPQGLPDVYSPYHHTKPTGAWPPAGATVYPTAVSSGHGHSCTGAHAHSHDVARPDFHSYKVPEESPDQPELLQVQTE
ncbi:rhomboid domain-containing protein 2 [Dendropsophus ebraccatus]|uniref:rhomboid domain-containing protein 2 n=1 Tax=Dendropsophus ebraccatus TaxID=150705 RepID=UPI00383142E5